MADTLPVEVVAHILGFLRVADRKEAALVSQSWYEASLDPILQRATKFTIHANPLSTKWLHELLKRRSLHLILDNIDVSNIRRILKSKDDLSKNLLSLTLKSSDITEKLFTELLSYCSSLQTLDVSCCNTLFMTGMLLSKQSDVDSVTAALTHVHELNLSTIRYLSDSTLNRLLTVCPNTERLFLAGNQIIFHSDGLYKESSKRPSGNTAVLTYANIMNQLKIHVDKITMLDLSRTSVHDEALRELATIDGLHLRELRLVCCRELSFSESFSDFCSKQGSLKKLDLSHCDDFTDADLASICQHLQNLKELSVGHCRRLTDISVSKLRQLTALQALDLSSCYVLTSMGLVLGLCKTIQLQFTELNLSCCSSVRDGFVAEACIHLPHLTILNLSSCAITDKSVHYIAKYLLHLTVLQLAWCKNVSDNGLLGIVDERDPRLIQEENEGLCKCTRKRHLPAILDLRKTASVDATAEATSKDTLCSSKLHIVVHKQQDWVPISNLRHLQVLDLSSCHRVTDASLTKVMTFPELKALHVSLCPSITDASLTAVATNMPSLENLHMAQCPKITDAGLEASVQRLWRLHTLDVSGCDGLTNASLDALGRHGKRLQHLDVSLCGNMTADAVDALEDRMKHLRSLQKRLVVGSTFDFL